eukprot:CAMPEP_0174335136 /NCGR_PEP_ID=MMETSP0810-20121108/20535_1 /TAXON_ID=73025 ORGANISM="Eutreptiella gymnastica-like, Strain CCMP1594" /NCGR_SAMPLE_ID=MMETSP0810 /ASSEMBLY_ACC=CAM_ASM_000659 /LENGTH=36 /DNA_ID= /DNA_START= /DNA_END= /DNA_ORIENTATION=
MGSLRRSGEEDQVVSMLWPPKRTKQRASGFVLQQLQ